MNGRKACLDKAAGCVLGQRETDYGTPEDNFGTIAKLWTAYKHGTEFTSLDVAMMMTLLKVARVASNTERPAMDSFVDIAGYAACAYELAEPPSMPEDVHTPEKPVGYIEPGDIDFETANEMWRKSKEMWRKSMGQEDEWVPVDIENDTELLM